MRKQLPCVHVAEKTCCKKFGSQLRKHAPQCSAEDSVLASH